jgi:predicted Zn-dependent protease
VEARRDALWWQVISLRHQGRLADALAAARRLTTESADPAAHLAVAQVLLEGGRAREAAAEFEVVATSSVPKRVDGAPDPALGRTARALSWNLTHAATAYAAARDTLRLRRLGDSVEALGTLEALGRDRRLHHHLRGLLWLARGRPSDAADAFRRALQSSNNIGYTRSNLELGRVLMTLGRPREALAVLGPALRGDLQASNYYVTHAELHDAMAQAFAAAGEVDSARTHFAWVARAWQRADSPFRERGNRARTQSTGR